MRRHLRLSILSFLLLVPMILNAQVTSIRGVVSDSSSGEKIPYANVFIIGTSKGAATSLVGFYLIPGVNPGRYEIAASAVGFQRKIVTVNVTVGAPIELNFELAPAIVELEEVVVTEEAKREIKEISTSVHVLSQRDLALVPVTVQQDIFRSIQILPGIVSTSDVSSQFYVRGGSSDQNLIMMDGIRLYSPFHAFGVFSIFDSDLINTTEVYTGAFPAGYGGRLSSVVNLTTRDGRATGFSGRANVNFLSSKVQLEGPTGENVRWLFNARKSIFESSYQRFLNQSIPVSFYDVFGKVTIQGDASHTRYNVLAFATGDDLRSSSPTEPDYYWNNLLFGAKASTLFGDRLFVNTLVSVTTMEARRDTKASTVATPASSRVQELSIRVEATHYSDVTNLYFFGFDFSFPKLSYDFVNSNGVPRSESDTSPEVSAWIRSQMKWEDLQLDAGLHADLGSLIRGGEIFDFLQPRIHASYRFIDNWKLKASYGRITQNVITVGNEDDLISIFDAWITIPENLPSQKADHYVVGLQGNVIPQFSTDIQAYYKDFESLVTYNREKLSIQESDYVSSTSEAYGFEGLLRYSIPWLDLYAAYTYGKVTINQSGFVYPPRYDRRHTVKALSTVRPIRPLELTLRWEFGTGFPYTPTIGYYDRLTLGNVDEIGFVGDLGAPYARLGEKNSSRLPSYHRLDASLFLKFASGPLSGKVGLHVINVYDQKNIFYYDRMTGQRINLMSFYPTATFELEYTP